MQRKKSSTKITKDNILNISVDELITSIHTRKTIPNLHQSSEEEMRFLPQIDISSLATNE